MRYLEMLHWPQASGITLGDSPVYEDSGIQVYELISKLERIIVSASGKYLGTYEHVALKDGLVYVFDHDARKLLGSLGPYQIYEVSDKWELIPLA